MCDRILNSPTFELRIGNTKIKHVQVLKYYGYFFNREPDKRKDALKCRKMIFKR